MTTDLLKNLDEHERVKAESIRLGRSAPSPPKADSPFHGITTKPASDITSLHKLAVLYHSRKQLEQAERLYQQALTLFGLSYGLQDARVGQVLNNVARLYFEEGWYSEAEPLFERSLEIIQKQHGPDHPKVARRLENLGELYFVTGREEEALDAFKRAIAMKENALGAKDPATLKSMRAFARMLRKMDCAEEAAEIETLCHSTRAKFERRAPFGRRTGKPTTSASRPGERRYRTDRRTPRSHRRAEES